MRSVSKMVPLVVMCALFAAVVEARTRYVVTSASWGPSQEAALTTTGAIPVFKHTGSGIAIVESDDPSFSTRLAATGAFTSVNADQTVQWQPPVRTVELEESAVTPENETFINAQWNLLAVEARGAWDEGFTGTGVRVAILDGGIHSTHVDLDGNVDVAKSASFVPSFAFNQDVGTFWHGTHVAGIVAAEDNGIGTIGIAPNATIVGVKVLHGGSGDFSWVISGILYAATPISDGGAGADIINMSLGALFPKNATGGGSLVAALNQAVNYASGRGVLVVSAAGNSGLDLDHSRNFVSVPAQSGSGIAVTATAPMGFAVGYPNGATNFRRFASYSNYGNSVTNVAAPGGDFVLPGSAVCTIPRVPSGSITTACWVFDMVISTSRGSGASISSYSFAAGTSMAAPAASAVAALIKQKYPAFLAGDLKAKLAQTADDEGKKGNDPYYGKGFVNARRAVTE